MNSTQTDDFVSYLNDHLAGSVAALELLDHLRESAEEETFRSFCARLHQEISADQDILQKLIAEFGAGQGLIKMAAAWLLEKAGWTKFKIAGDGEGESGRLQALEALALGINGKKLLWLALAPLANGCSPLQSLDFALLLMRADEQLRSVEGERLKAAECAFSETRGV
ncbi:MAG: hypothetical protein QOD99_3016 [Chthoniobacter sp.]|jgi:hypothetical protein|nr:hypothetical protein [Chthoniobacter sp.]